MRALAGKWLTLWVALVGLLMAAGCGGGGGGGGTAVPDSYTGETAQAVITADNAVLLAGVAWDGSRAGRDISEILPEPPDGGGAAAGIAPAGVLPLARGLVLRTVATLEDTVPGDCGGTADITVTANDETGVFSGAMTFNDYCTMDTVLTGGLTFSGKGDLVTEEVSSFKLTFNNLTLAEGEDSWSFVEGSVAYALASDGSETDTLQLVIRDNDGQKAYWFKDYVIDISAGETEDLVTVTGRFYNPDYGYVVVSTPTALVVTDDVIGGVLLFSGVDSKARLTFNLDLSNLLEVDADNDGVYEASFPNSI